MNQFMRQIEEKVVAHEIEILLWSDRMDLVALANNKGEVALHRLTWSRAWTLSPLKEGDLVKRLSWRPDGKVLVIGYQSGVILLVSVENKAILHTFEVDGEISCIHWAQEASESKIANKNVLTSEETNEYIKFLDFGNVFLPYIEGSSFNSVSTEPEVSNLFENQKELNLLLVGTKAGLLYISIFGCLLPIKVNVCKLVGGSCSVLDVYMSENLNMIFATICDEFETIKLAFINSEIFKSHRKELFATAVKYENLTSLLLNISTTILDIKEHWESIYLEMDSKLSKFASKVPKGTLSADFLDLLMFGICTSEMQEFLLQDLTKKGLEKFGQTIEMSYGNIHKLLLKNISKAGQSIAYHLLDLRGMARLEHKYKILGLEEDKITAALGANGAFLVKGGEMQQIITHSGISYKVFFRWLYTAILHLMEETIPPEIQKSTQQDIAIISEFLLNFDEIGNKNGSSENQQGGFIMERLGQYLADSPLTVPSKMQNEWEKFLGETECLRNHPHLIQHYRDKSLVQQFNILKDTVSEIFLKPAELIGMHITNNTLVSCENIANNNVQITYINNGNDSIYVALMDKQSPSIYFLNCQFSNNSVKVSGLSLYFTQGEETFNLLDIKFYSNTVLSLLLQDSNKTCILAQCPLQKVIPYLTSIDLIHGVQPEQFVSYDGCTLSNITLNCIAGFKASRFAISGARKVSIVLSDSKRKVRLYEMEVDEEDDEENDLTASTMRESDASVASDCEL